MSYFMKKPCKLCPFRMDVKPYLTPERGEELAYSTQNSYNSFACHQTVEYDEEEPEIDEDDNYHQSYDASKTKNCAGFLTMQINQGAHKPKGFTPAVGLVYDEAFDMVQAYENPEEYFDYFFEEAQRYHRNNIDL